MPNVNASRLLVLGTLAEWGPMHGHQILRLTEQSNAELWSAIRPSAIYGVLSRLEEEGLIEALRVERQGRFPERTIYGITDAGQGTFRQLLDQALQWVPVGSTDPFDVALTVLPANRQNDLALSIEHRRQTLTRQLTEFTEAGFTLGADPAVPRVAIAIINHMRHRLQAELHWLDDLKEMLPALRAEFDRPKGSAGVTPADST